MTRADCEAVAEVLRQRIADITKMFEPPDWRIPREQIPQAMKVQIAVMARDLDRAFAKQDPAFQVCVEAVLGEMNRGGTVA